MNTDLDARLREYGERWRSDHPETAPVPDLGPDNRAGRSDWPRRRGAVLVAAAVVVASIAGGSILLADRVHRRSGPSATSRGTASLPANVGPTVTVATLTKYRWRALPSAPIIGRYDEAWAWTGKQLIVWGGTSGNDVLGDGAMYDPASRVWTKLPPAPLTPRIGASGTWVGGAFIVWGGYTTDMNQQFSDGARYDPARNTWTRLPSAPVTSPSRQELLTAGNHAVLLTTAKGLGVRTIDASSYDPARNRWTSLPAVTTPKNHDIDQLVSLSVGSTVFVWSEWAHTVAVKTRPGITGTDTSSGIDAYRLDGGAAAWSSAPVLPGQGLTADNPLWTGRRILLPQDGRYCGGCAGPPLFNPTAVTIDPVTGARTALPTGPVSGDSSGFVWTGAAMLGVNAGSTGGGRHPGDTAALDPTIGRWTRLESAPTGAQPSEEQITVWTGDRLLTWGINTVRNPGHVASGAEFAPTK